MSLNQYDQIRINMLWASCWYIIIIIIVIIVIVISISMTLI